MTALTLDRLGKRFGDHDAVRELSLQIPSGAFLVLLGPSGCGKSTTLRMVAGLEDPTSGTIAFGDRIVADGARGRSVPPSKRGLGMVFQSYALWPHMTVRQNVAWPLAVAGWSRRDRDARVGEVLESLEIAQLADRTPADISGGQQQRVAIARTIAPKPDIVLFDEPLSNLDARLRVETRSELGRVHRESGATSVYVTHDQIEALALATHIAVMNEGRLEQFGTPQELLERPATVFVASFLGSPAAVLLPVEVEGGGLVFAGRAIGVADARTPGVAHVMYRPEDVLLDDSGSVDIRVLESTPQGGRHLVTGRVADGRRVTVVADRAAQPGDSTRLRLPERPSAQFGRDGARL
ncbi:ABC transporter ATP-binding protein [Leucobacter sp. wl10]|uniref:ABC transporter ATP-binding protein n=1 Tax=Leucobacter sp. wl10 TaxID=2304677 RepID=UPI000E5A5BBF|nr:ABC transporter ATP-binding protein [Leucobacter sp. wl10]RGE19385.1 ABC transporter ATP-binding protein [Leucobacter sp. wl10]